MNKSAVSRAPQQRHGQSTSRARGTRHVPDTTGKDIYIFMVQTQLTQTRALRLILSSIKYSLAYYRLVDGVRQP